MKRRVLVTGGSGFVGSHLVRRLINDGHEVFVLARETSHWNRLNDCIGAFTPVVADINDLEALRNIISKVRPEWIFHMANAGLYGGISDTDSTVAQTNLIGLMNLLAAASSTPYELFVNGSSSAEYGPKDEAMHEGMVCQPMSTYAVTKLAATTYASMIARLQNKPIVSFRIFSPFGPFDEEKRLIPTAIRSLLDGKDVVIAPKVVRDYIYIDNVIDAFIAAVLLPNKEALKGEILNIGSGQQRSASEVIDLLVGKISSKSKVSWSEQQKRSWESPVWQADMTKTHKLLGWNLEVSFDAGILKTISWIKSNPLLLKHD
jgi:nucleoside-diphosphate-sugar epimerase